MTLYRLPKLIASLALALLVAACSDAPVSSAPGTPRLVLVDSVPLMEGDSAYIGNARDIAIAPDGSFVISDLLRHQILIFARDGSFAKKIGRAGSGPTEFSAPTRIALGGDSILYVVDRKTVKVIDPRDATYKGSYLFTQEPGPGQLVVSDGRLFVGQSDPIHGSSFSYSSDNGATFTEAGYLPAVLTNPIVQPMFGVITLAVSGDRVATAYWVTNLIYITDLAGNVIDSITVPAVHRHGIDAGVFVQFGEAPTEELAAVTLATSKDSNLHWLPSGLLALVTADAETKGLQFLSSEWLYLSLIDPTTHATCVDALVPGPSDPPMQVGFRGDTLFVLSQPVDSVSSGQAVIHMYRMDASTCPGFEE